MDFTRKAQAMLSVGLLAVTTGNEVTAASLAAPQSNDGDRAAPTRATDNPSPEVVADEQDNPSQCGLESRGVKCGAPQFGCVVCGLRRASAVLTEAGQNDL